jgi:hypothetical protein
MTILVVAVPHPDGLPATQLHLTRAVTSKSLII